MGSNETVLTHEDEPHGEVPQAIAPMDQVGLELDPLASGLLHDAVHLRLGVRDSPVDGAEVVSHLIEAAIEVCRRSRRSRSTRALLKEDLKFAVGVLFVLHRSQLQSQRVARHRPTETTGRPFRPAGVNLDDRHLQNQGILYGRPPSRDAGGPSRGARSALDGHLAVDDDEMLRNVRARVHDAPV